MKDQESNIVPVDPEKLRDAFQIMRAAYYWQRVWKNSPPPVKGVKKDGKG